MIEDKQSGYRAENGGIGYIENGPERIVLSAKKRDPIRHKSFPNVEIDHIHYLTMQPWSGTSFWRISQHNAIEYGVKKVSNGTPQNKGNAGDVPNRHFILNEIHQIISDSAHGDDAESGEHKFAIVATQLKSEGHSRIECIMQFEPVSHQDDLALNAIFHIKMDQHFGELVKTQHKETESEIFDIRIFQNRVDYIIRWMSSSTVCPSASALKFRTTR